MISSVSETTGYPQLCKKAAENDIVFSRFKREPEYRMILEHVHPELGYNYYLLSQRIYESKMHLLELATINDTVGGSEPFLYPFGSYSPTTLRYFKVACDLDAIFDDMSEMRVLEIGGGYGGQCVVSNVVSGFKSWTIVDLPEVNMLQERYLSHFPISTECISYKDINKDKNEYDLVISNYAFSECVKDVQEHYIQRYMSNDERLYMTLNYIPNLPEEVNHMNTREELVSVLGLTENKERPLTFSTNFIGTRGEDRKLYE